MTAPDDLPELLRELARVIPERFIRVENWPEEWWAVRLDNTDSDEMGFFSIGDTRINLPRLEEALREECQAQSWVFSLQGEGLAARPERRWTVVVRTDKMQWLSYAYAPTPAHALAAAMVSALNAPGGSTGTGGEG